MSDKRLNEADKRWDVRQETMMRARFRCEAGDGAFSMRCGGPLDVHEIVARSVAPGSHLDVTITAAVCLMHKKGYPGFESYLEAGVVKNWCDKIVQQP